MKLIDLRSDTVTRLTPAMRRAMAAELFGSGAAFSSRAAPGRTSAGDQPKAS